jgi:hypothetical protein
MLSPAPRVKLVDDPLPVGDMPLAPLAATGRSEAELAQAMAERSLGAVPHSDAAPNSLAALLRRATRRH